MSKHALRALTEVIQDANHDNGIKAWPVFPGSVDTEMGDVVPGAKRENFLAVDEVVDVVAIPASRRATTSSSGPTCSSAPCAIR